ncbi:MAG: glycosyltransferase family 2 protein, partial [Elioraea tepidiphila]
MHPAPADSAAPPPQPEGPPAVSVVVAVLNEAENIPAVAAEITAAFAAGPAFEVVFVDDGSTDGTAAAVRALAAADPRMRLVRHAERCGKSAAVRTGVVAARAPWIATMDGDGQNDPAEISRLLAAFEAAPGAGLAMAQRRGRKDTGFKRLQSRLANAIR